MGQKDQNQTRDEHPWEREFLERNPGLIQMMVPRIPFDQLPDFAGDFRGTRVSGFAG